MESGDTAIGCPRQAQAPDRKASIVQQVDAARATIREQYPDWPEELRNLGVGAIFITECRAQFAWSIGPILSPAPPSQRPHESDCSHCIPSLTVHASGHLCQAQGWYRVIAIMRKVLDPPSRGGLRTRRRLLPTHRLLPVGNATSSKYP